MPKAGQARDLEEFVRESLAIAKKLPVFSGAETDAEEGLGESFAVGPVGQTRDSGLLERTNFRVVATDLQERFGEEDVEVLRFDHWAVGWVEELAWRAVDDRGRPTEVAAAAYAWARRLEDYPSADDDALSEAESELAHENVVSALEDYLRRHDDEPAAQKLVRRFEREPEEVVSELYRMLSDRGVRGIEDPEQHSVREEELERELRRIGWVR